MTKKICFILKIITIYAVFTVIFCDKSSNKEGLKIVSLSPAMTEILFALDAGDNIVGVTTYCDYPVQAKKIYKVGDFSHPSIERIVGLKPNLVIVNLPEQRRIKKNLDKLKINTFVSSPKSLMDMYREIAEIGKIVDRERPADSLVEYMQTNIQRVPYERIKRVYIELSPRPIVTIGRGTFLNELLELAGGKNIFADLNKDYPVVPQEEVIRRNPEVIILLHPEDIKNRMGWRKVAAIENAKVYSDLKQDYLMRAGPRLVQGFKELKEIICE